jgi:hypothetical protein
LTGLFGLPARARRRRVRRASPTATLWHPASLRPCPDIHVRSFDRFAEIPYLVEKASDLTLPDFRPLLLPCSIFIYVLALLAANLDEFTSYSPPIPRLLQIPLHTPAID